MKEFDLVTFTKDIIPHMGAERALARAGLLHPATENQSSQFKEAPLIDLSTLTPDRIWNVDARSNGEYMIFSKKPPLEITVLGKRT